MSILSGGWSGVWRFGGGGGEGVEEEGRRLGVGEGWGAVMVEMVGGILSWLVVASLMGGGLVVDSGR